LDKLQRIVRNDFVKDDLLLFTSSRFQLLLDKARTVLIATKLNDISENILVITFPRKT